MKPYFHLFIFCCICLLSCSINSDKEKERTLPFLGLDPVPDASLIDEQSDALLLWARQGTRRKLTVVHCSASGGLAPVFPDKIVQLRSLFKKEQWEELGRSGRRGDAGLFSSRNYVSAAVSLGIADRIYWVIPEPLLLFSDAEARVRKFLENHATRFRHEDIDGMLFDRGCVSGKLYGVAVSICNLETLPLINDAVVFDLDVDFLAQFAAAKRYSLLRGLKDISDIVTTKRLKAASAAVGVTDLSSRSIRRYVGTQTVEAMRDPQLVKAPSPPEVWLMREATDIAFSGGEDISPVLRGALKKYPADEPLVVFGSIDAALRGREQSVLESLGQLCATDKDSCFALLYAARELKKQQHDDAAERFAKKAVEVRPSWPEAFQAYGDLLYDRHDYRNALRQYQEIERLENSLSLQLALGDCFYFLDQKNDALKHYEQGLAFSNEAGGYRLNDRDKDSLTRPLKLYEDQGDSRRVKTIRQLLGIQ